MKIDPSGFESYLRPVGRGLVENSKGSIFRPFTYVKHSSSFHPLCVVKDVKKVSFLFFLVFFFFFFCCFSGHHKTTLLIVIISLSFLANNLPFVFSWFLFSHSLLLCT